MNNLESVPMTEKSEKQVDDEVHRKACDTFGGMRLLGDWQFDDKLNVVPLQPTNKLVGSDE